MAKTIRYSVYIQIPAPQDGCSQGLKLTAEFPTLEKAIKHAKFLHDSTSAQLIEHGVCYTVSDNVDYLNLFNSVEG